MADPCARASSQYANGDIKRALSNINRCQKDLESKLRKYKNNSDVIPQIHLQLAKAYRFEGQIYFAEQNPGKANSAFTSALKSIREAGTSSDAIGLKGQIQYSLAIVALMREQYDYATQLLEKAKNNFFSADMGEQGLEVLLRLGGIYRDRNQIEQALDYYDQAHNNRKQASSRKNRRIYDGRAKLEKGKILHRLQDSKAIKHVKKAKKQFSKAKYDEGTAQALLVLSELYQSEPEKSYDYLLEAKALGQMTESPEIQGVVLTRLGVLALKTGEFEKGKDLLLQGLKYRTEAGDTVGTAQTLVELSRITLITSRNDEDLHNAKTFAEQALDLYEETNHQYGQATTLELLGSINTKLDDLDTAKNQIQVSKSIFADAGDLAAEARMLTQMGLIYDKEDRQNKAITVLDKAISIFDKVNNPQGKAEALHILALQYRNDNPEKSIEILSKSRELYVQLIGDNKDMQVILESIDKTIDSIRKQLE